MSPESNYILELSHDYVTFDSIGSTNSVFFDEINKQAFIVRNRDANGIQVKSTISHFNLNINLEDSNDIISIKLSPTFDILALQRTHNTVEFVNFVNETPTHRYSQTCKAKNSKIIGFVWTHSNEVVFITDSGIEFYRIFSEKAVCKLLKSFNISVNWFIYQPSSSILILSSSTSNNVLQPFLFRSSSMYKLTKFEVDLVNSKAQKPCLFERDVTLVNLYGKTCILILNHESFSKDRKGAHIVIYVLQKEGLPKKSHILQLRLTGRFAINVVDDIIIVHHQTSQTSLLFDIRFPSSTTQGDVTYHLPIVPPYTIRPFKLDNSDCELYSSNWVIFQPNIVIDAKLGYMWQLQINLLPLCRMISNITQIFDFLMCRKNSKPVVLNLCKETIGSKLSSKSNHLDTISFLFQKLNDFYKESIQMANETSNTKKDIIPVEKKPFTVIDQTDMFSIVFSIFETKSEEIDEDLAIAVLFEYINSLHQHCIPIQYFIYELFINILIREKRYYQLHQFLQYHVFTPCKPLACLLLSLQPHYPHATQLALDMFKEIGVLPEDIIDIFLSQSDIFRALRYVQSHGNMDSISARKFLEFASAADDPQVFFSVFKLFEERNLRLRGSPSFVKGEHCEGFVDEFESTFGVTSSLKSLSHHSNQLSG